MGSAVSTKKAKENKAADEQEEKQPLVLDPLMPSPTKMWSAWHRDGPESPRSGGESFRSRSVSRVSMRMSWVDMVNSGSGESIHLVQDNATMFDNFRQRTLVNLTSGFEDKFRPVNKEGDTVVLGSGMEGKVVLVERKDDGEKFALKTLSSEEEDVIFSSFELNHLSRMDHPRVVKIMSVYPKDNGDYLLTFELGHGGDMFQFLQNTGPLPEARAVKIVKQMIQCVQYLHLRNIIHRDLKLENFVFRNKTSDELLLIDFGLSTYCSEDQFLSQKTGTIHYMAPEVYRRSYSFEVDMWSVGVLTYMLLSAKRPFRGKKDAEIIQNILSVNYDFSNQVWENVSNSGKSFIRALLCADPERRLSPKQALEHEWIVRLAEAPLAPPEDMSLRDLMISKFVAFESNPVLKQFCLQIVAHELQYDKVKWLLPYFEWLVGENPGVVTFDRLRSLFPTDIVPEELFLRVFQSLDKDGKLFFTWTSFVAAFLEPAAYKNDKTLLYRVFKKLSAPTEDKTINAQDLEYFFDDLLTTDEVQEMIQEAKVSVKDFQFERQDTAGVQWIEYLYMMRNSVHSLNEEEKKARDMVRQRSISSTFQVSSQANGSGHDTKQLKVPAISEEDEAQKSACRVSEPELAS